MTDIAYYRIAPDPHDGTLTLWRGTEPDDDYPVPEADERTMHPDLWALIVRHLGELNSRSAFCACGAAGCSDGGVG